MKFLNEIDGADKVKQDSNNRFVTDVEKASWNNKQNALGYTPVNKAGDSMTGDLKVNGDIVAAKELVVGYNGTTESLQRHKWKYDGSTGYLELWRYSRQNKWELSATFPNRNTGEGGLVVEGKQMATEDYVNGKVKTDVPVGAKFTDTTYTEISESEINTGTASTLRTITARRIKFILDKVQGWISNLTKVDVGLGDVDNVQQATKTEFNAHNNDNTRHITTNERTAWNNKWDYNETTIENVKVNKAVDADTVNGKTVAVNVPSGAKFTDTITTINSKTGAITKADIVALGIPAQDTVYTHPTSHPASMITESSTKRFVSDAEKTAWNGKQDALGYTPVNKAGDTMTGDLKVNGNIVAGTELIVGYNGTTESLQRYKWKYNGSTGHLELWRYNNQNKWELSATFPNRGTGSGGLIVEGKRMATESYVNNKVKTDVPANAKFTDTIYTHPSTHPASMITESATKRFVSDTEKNSWNSKAEISDIPTKVGQLQNDKNYVTQSELGEAGLGDMTKGVYDTNNNGKVDIAEVAETVVGNEIQLGGRFKIAYNDIEDSLDFEVI